MCDVESTRLIALARAAADVEHELRKLVAEAVGDNDPMGPVRVALRHLWERRDMGALDVLRRAFDEEQAARSGRLEAARALLEH